MGFLLYNSFLFLRKYGADDLTWNTSLISVGDSPFKNLNISIAKVWIFLWLILKQPCFSKSSSKLALKFEYTILNAFSCNLFILLTVLEWNIQISGQELNWGLMKAFFVCLGSCDWQYGERALSFLLTVLQILLKCSSNFDLESKVTPSSFSLRFNVICNPVQALNLVGHHT